MPDELTTTTPPTLAKPKKGRPFAVKPPKNFAKTVTVILPDKQRIEIPVNELAMRDQCKVLASKAKDLFEYQLEQMKTKTLMPAELKDILTAAERMDSLMRTQYAADMIGLAGGSAGSTGLGKAMGAMMAGVAKGAAQGTADGLLGKIKAMEQAAKKVEPITEIEGKK